MENKTITAVVLSGMCCGCAACVAICPKGAAAMQPDSYGYCISMIDEETCIKCGLCLRACPMHNAAKTLARS